MTYETERQPRHHRLPQAECSSTISLCVVPPVFPRVRIPGLKPSGITRAAGVRRRSAKCGYQCAKCGYHSHVQHWRYACSRHETDYRPATSAALANAMSIAGQITSRGGKEWLQRFLANLGEW